MDQYRVDQADQERLDGTIEALALPAGHDAPWWNELETFLERLFNELGDGSVAKPSRVERLAYHLLEDGSVANPSRAGEKVRLLSEEAWHYGHAARREKLRWQVLSVGLLAALELAVVRATADSVWWQRLSLMILLLPSLWLTLRVTFAVIDGTIRWNGGSERISRRDAGVQFYVGSHDGELALIEGKRMNSRRAATGAAFDSHRRAQLAAYAMNLGLVTQGEYVGSEGETLPPGREEWCTRKAANEAEEAEELARQEAYRAERAERHAAWRAAHNAELLASADELLRDGHAQPSDITLAEAEARLGHLESMVSELEYMPPRGPELSHQLSALIGPFRDRVIQLADGATCTCCDAEDVDPESRLQARSDIVLCRECDGRAGVLFLDFTNCHSAHHLHCEIHGIRVLWERAR